MYNESLSLQVLETRPCLRRSLPHWPSNFPESRWSGGGEFLIKKFLVWLSWIFPQEILNAPSAMDYIGSFKTEMVRWLATWFADNTTGMLWRPGAVTITSTSTLRKQKKSSLTSRGRGPHYTQGWAEMGKNFNFLGMHISQGLGWTLNTTHVTEKAQQRLWQGEAFSIARVGATVKV